MEVVALMVLAIIFFMIVAISIILGLIGIFQETVYILTILYFIKLVYKLVCICIDYKGYKRSKAKVIDIDEKESKRGYKVPIIAYKTEDSLYKKTVKTSTRFGEVNMHVPILYNKKDPNDFIIDPASYIFDECIADTFFFVILLITSILCLIF